MDKSLQHKFIKTILLIPLGFLFLVAFYIPKTNIPVYDIIMGISFIIALLCLNKKIIISILKISKYKHFQCLILFSLWVFFIGILFTIIGKYPFVHFIYATFLLFLFNNFTWYLYPVIIVPTILSEKTVIKYIYMAIYLLCIYGLIAYLLSIFNLDFLDIIQKVFVNRRNAEDIVKTRIISVFEEPSHFGCFLCVMLPFIYKLSLSKYKIFNNNFLNIFIKRSYIFLVFLTICFIQSPIWILFFIIITAIYFFKTIIYYTKNHIVRIFASVILILLLFFSFNTKPIDISNTYLHRISKVVEVITSWDGIVLADNSFATRLYSYAARVRLCIDYPITGVGYKNAEYNIEPVITNKMRITQPEEIKKKIADSTNSYTYINGSILWILLSDTGLVGTFLFYLFLIFSILRINKISKNTHDCLHKDFVTAIKYTYITIICLSIYETNINTIYLWFFYGLTNVFIISSNKYQRR